MSLELMAVLDDILECSVCLNRLQDPKRLPCGHIFCKKCLVPLRTKACPKCRQNFSTNVTDLPSDTTTVKLLESCENRRACRNCKSNFAIQCHHCPLKLCGACLKKHMREIFLEKQEILRANLPDDIILSNQAQFCAEVMSQVKKSIEAAREKATTYLNYHYDEVGRLWQERMDNWNDFSLIQRAHNDLCSMEGLRSTTPLGVPLCVFYESQKESDQAIAAIVKIQDDLDSTIAELIGLQWKLNRNSTKSREVLGIKLSQLQDAKKTPPSSSSSKSMRGIEQGKKAMDETSDEESLSRESPPKQLPEGTAKQPSDTQASPSYQSQRPSGYSERAAPTTGAFCGGTPVAQTTGGLFGRTPVAQTTGGLFGSTQAAQTTGGSLFGSTQVAQTTGGLFGSTQVAQTTGGNLLGSTQVAQTTGGLFGSNKVVQTTGGLFGRPQAAQTTGGLFGRPQAAQTGLFGSVTITESASKCDGASTQSHEKSSSSASVKVEGTTESTCHDTSFEEERFEYVKKTSSRKQVPQNGTKDTSIAHITLYSHRVLGLFTTPALSFCLLNTLTNDDPEQFPAADDDDQKSQNETILGEKSNTGGEEKGNDQNVESLEESEDNYDDDSGDDGSKQEETEPNAQDPET